MQFSKPIKIECCWPEQGQYVLACMAFEHGATVSDVVSHLGINSKLYILSIWGRRCQLNHALKANDRVEFNLPLVKDPRQRLLEVKLK